MSTATTIPKSAVGKLYLVSGLSGGREVYLGKALEEPYEERLTLEGKMIAIGARGTPTIRPFQTTASFFLLDAATTVQRISHAGARDEAERLLALSVTNVSPATFPYLYRWIDAALGNERLVEPPAEERPAADVHPLSSRVGLGGVHGSSLVFYDGFLATAEEFRRILFQSKQVTTTRELDKVIELEGDLKIEIGKVTNQAAVRFNQLVTDEPELVRYLEAFQGGAFPLSTTLDSMAGWAYLMNRFLFAKNWARRNGKAPLVRDINALFRDGLIGLEGIVLDHCASLDTLITETFNQYGLALEDPLELEPLAGVRSVAPVSVTPAEPPVRHEPSNTITPALAGPR